MNSTTMFISALAGLVLAITGSYIAWRKWKPETAQIIVTNAERVNSMTLEFASAALAENNDLQREINELRMDFNQYRRDTDSVIAELKAELRAERREKEQVKAENAVLRARVDELEAEVAQLKAAGKRKES